MHSGTRQARLLDFSRRFNEAASRYHELSFIPDIDEEERIYMLYVPPTGTAPSESVLELIELHMGST